MSDKKKRLLKLLDFGNEVDTSVGFMNVSGQNTSLINGIRFLWYAVNYKNSELPTYSNPFSNYFNNISAVIPFDNKKSVFTNSLYHMKEDLLCQIEDDCNNYYNRATYALLAFFPNPSKNISGLDSYGNHCEYKIYLKGYDAIGGFEKHLAVFNKFLKLDYNTKKNILTNSDISPEYEKEFEYVMSLGFNNRYKSDEYTFFHALEHERAREIWSDKIETYLAKTYPELYPTPYDVDEDTIHDYMKVNYEENYIRNWYNNLETIVTWMKSILSGYKTYCRELKDE